MSDYTIWMCWFVAGLWVTKIKAPWNFVVCLGIFIIAGVFS